MVTKSNQKPNFELFDHTADIGICAYGSDLSEAFKNAALGMFSIIFHDSIPEIEPKGEYRIKLIVSDIEQLLVDWLDEILYIFTTEHIMMVEYDIKIEKISNEYQLDAIVAGQILKDKEIKKTREIKAVTYHMLEIKQNDHWMLKIIFDI